MNFEALPSNCFNIGKKVKMKVTSAVPLCLLAGMAIVTCGCTAMKLRSTDSTARVEAVQAYTDPVDQVYIACLDFPDDVRLKAFNELVKDKNQAYIDVVAKIVLTKSWWPKHLLQPSENQRASFPLSFRVEWSGICPIDTAGKEFRNAVYRNISQDALLKVLETACLTPWGARKSILQELLCESPHTLKALKTLRGYSGGLALDEALKKAGEGSDSGSFVVESLRILKGENLKSAAKDTDFAGYLDSEVLFALYGETKDEQIFANLLEKSDEALSGKILKLYPEKFLAVCESRRGHVSAEKRKEWDKILIQKYPKSELALNLLFNSELDKESMVRVLENNAPDIILEKVKEGALLDKITNKSNGYSYSVKKEDMARFLKDPKGNAKEEIESYRWYADGYEGRLTFIDLLNASPAWAAKIDPALAATLLEIDYYVYARAGHDSGEHSTKPLMGKSYESLSPQIAKAFLERGITYCDEGLCPVYKTLLRNVPLQTVYEIVKKKTGLTPRFYETMAGLINARELNDETVEALLKLEFAPSAVGVRRLQAALKAKGVSDASKAKIRAYIEKVRAEAVANEAKAKEVRLVIDHCYVGMREIDHIVLPPQKGVMYGEKNGIITSFGWTAKQCYDWFEIENDRFQWEFAKKFGLSNFKFDMSVKAESQTSFNPELLLFDAMSGADTAVVSVPTISVQQWWLSTTRERGKNVEFLYNEEDKNNTLIMREIQ